MLEIHEDGYNERTVRALFCGSRNWTNRDAIASVIRELPENSIVIHGGARGADRLAAAAAHAQGVHTAIVAALWPIYGGSAGPRRNEMMLSLDPTVVYAFPMADSIGTWHMMRIAHKAGIQVVNYGYVKPGIVTDKYGNVHSNYGSDE